MVLCEGSRDRAEPCWRTSIRRPRTGIRATLAAGELSIKKTTRAAWKRTSSGAPRETGGNRTSAARLLEISHRALLYKIKEYGL